MLLPRQALPRECVLHAERQLPPPGRCRQLMDRAVGSVMRNRRHDAQSESFLDSFSDWDKKTTLKIFLAQHSFLCTDIRAACRARDRRERGWR